MTEHTAKIGRQMTKGAAWMIAMRWSIRSIGLVSVTILARLLVPEDFGILAMAMIVVGFFGIFSETYMDLALIQDADATRSHYDTAWTLRVLQGSGVAVIIVLIAPFASSYFDDSRIEPVVQTLALGIFINGFENIGMVAFRKELNFLKDYQFGVCKKMAGFLVAVLLAFLLRNYWALAAGFVSASFAGVILSYRMHPYRPRFSLTKTREIWSFSQWMLAWRIGNFLSQKTDQFVVGGAAGTTTLGSYYIAAEVASAPTDELAMPIGRAMFPAFAKLMHDTVSFNAAIVSSFGWTAVLVLPTGFGLSAIAEDLVIVMLSAKWLASVSLLQWLAVFGAASALSYTLLTPLFVMRKGKLAAIYAWLQFVAVAITLSLAANLGGVQEIAMARTMLMIAFLPITFCYLKSACPISWAQMAGVLWRPLAASLIMLVAVRVLHVESVSHPLATLALDVLLGVITYSTTMSVFWLLAGRPQGVEQQIFDHLISEFKS